MKYIIYIIDNTIVTINKASFRLVSCLFRQSLYQYQYYKVLPLGNPTHILWLAQGQAGGQDGDETWIDAFIL